LKSWGEGDEVWLRLFATWRLCVIIVFQPVDDSRDTVFDQRHVEVDQQAKTLVGETEIGQKLLLVNRGKHLDGFDFDDDLVFDDQIGPESSIDTDVLLDYRNRLLAHRAETPAAQFIRQDGIVNRFQQARAKRRMNAESGIDDLLGNGVLSQASPLQFSFSPSRQDAKNATSVPGLVDSTGRQDR